MEMKAREFMATLSSLFLSSLLS
ncbi:hypothetical protein CCACVL1_03379 [Corchorus capsularis]|uniref:Uncharacterized protein n=1 Tax=Corchorus capsularis TaxID=210143 RepID=A0A1R3JZQ6_COCAP|nr:hypothetical protein CCACVL1_03379 [Corchorus capsularis]